MSSFIRPMSFDPCHLTHVNALLSYFLPTSYGLESPVSVRAGGHIYYNRHPSTIDIPNRGFNPVSYEQFQT